MKLSKLTYGKIFVESLTFKVWQAYCRSRNSPGNPHGISEPYIFRKPTIDNIQQYILPSKTFSYWLFFYLIRETTLTRLKKSLPQSLKHQLKIALSLLPYSHNHVYPKIKQEWANWSETRPNDSIDIINFGVIPYEYRIQRPQQLARSLGQINNRIFYIETEFTLAITENFARINVRKTSHNVYVVTLSAPANYFIYKDTPSARGTNIIMASIRILMRQARIINPIAKIDHPFWGVLREKLGMPIIYDVMDLHEGFKESGKNILYKHQELVKNSDLVLSSSTYLYKTLAKKVKKLILLKNAGEYPHFQKSSTPMAPRPLDLRHLPGKIIGYYGALADWLDTNMIEATARAFPSDSLVFIGRSQNKQLELLAQKYPNIHLLGEKSYQDLPKYLSYFDVCLIPFKINELIKATNPVKIYEYFASGKPVVASPIPELKEYAKFMYFGASSSQFVKAIHQSFREKSSQLVKSRRLIAAQNIWAMRAKSLQTELIEFFPKVSVVILVYNHADLSKISIDSTLERSKYPNLELLAVDNKSDEDTIKMLKTYRGTPNIKVIFNPENYGFAKGNNVGMKLATGEYIILLNNDVRVTPGWIERLVYHARRKGVGLVGPVTNSIGNESKIEIEYDSNNRKQIEEKSADYIYAHWGETIKLRNIAAFAWIKSRAVYNKIGGLDERFGRGLFEDDDYCVRIGKAKLDIVCAEDAFVHHYGGASTNWGSPEFQLLFNTNKAKFESKWKTKWIPHQYRKK